jgi:hypothetical protein
VCPYYSMWMCYLGKVCYVQDPVVYPAPNPVLAALPI